MIDLGVILHKGSYLRSGWNVIDAFVVACNIAALLLELVHLFLYIVRILTYFVIALRISLGYKVTKCVYKHVI